MVAAVVLVLLVGKPRAAYVSVSGVAPIIFAAVVAVTLGVRSPFLSLFVIIFGYIYLAIAHSGILIFRWCGVVESSTPTPPSRRTVGIVLAAGLVSFAVWSVTYETLIAPDFWYELPDLGADRPSHHTARTN